jgi:hypothetical protein
MAVTFQKLLMKKRPVDILHKKDSIHVLVSSLVLMRNDNCLEKPHIEKLVAAQLVKKSPILLGTQNFVTMYSSVYHLTYPEADEFSPHPQPCFLKIHFNGIISTHRYPMLYNGR